MTIRNLKGATGSLYDEDSQTCHRAVQDLRDVLVQLGFRVWKKAVKEATLRVYIPGRPYPLLNPRFLATAADLDPAKDIECVAMAVWSNGDLREAVDRHLRSFGPTDGCDFVPMQSDGNNLVCHGHFILPVPFKGEPGSEEINFMALGVPLLSILRHFQRPL